MAIKNNITEYESMKDATAAIQKLANTAQRSFTPATRPAGTPHPDEPAKPQQRVFVIEYCYSDYEKLIDKVPSARHTVVLSGDATLGMIGAVEDCLINQDCNILSSRPEMRDAP